MLTLKLIGKTPSRSNSDLKSMHKTGASVALTPCPWILNDNFGNDVFHFNYLTSDSQLKLKLKKGISGAIPFFEKFSFGPKRANLVNDKYITAKESKEAKSCLERPFLSCSSSWIPGTRLLVAYHTVAALLLNLRWSAGGAESCNPSISQA